MGMDVEAVESVGRQLKQGAAAVDPIVGTLDKAVSSLAQLWDGPDAQRLIQSWPTFRKSLVAAQASIAGLGQSALNNASEQRQASGATGIIGGNGTFPSPTHVGSVQNGRSDPSVVQVGRDQTSAQEAAFNKWLPANGTEFRIGSSSIECVGLVNNYAEHLFPDIPWNKTVGANPLALQMYDGANPVYFDKIPAGEPPQPGDIVVVGSNIHSSAGHVAVVQTVDGNLPGKVVEQSGGDPNAHPPIPARATFTSQLDSKEDRAIIGYLRPKLSA